MIDHPAMRLAILISVLVVGTTAGASAQQSAFVMGLLSRESTADRVVNPQELGAARMASFIARPNVAEFVDVVMHERSLEFQMREFGVDQGSDLAGRTLRDANIRERSGALILALRDADGSFTTNPTGDTVIHPGHVIIAVGTERDFKLLLELIE